MPHPQAEYTIYQAVAEAGWTLAVRENLDCEEGLGAFFPCMRARALKGDIIAVRPHDDSWGNAYSISHEICEVRVGFRHSEYLYIDQCNLLAKWHTKRTIALNDQGGDQDAHR